MKVNPAHARFLGLHVNLPLKLEIKLRINEIMTLKPNEISQTSFKQLYLRLCIESIRWSQAVTELKSDLYESFLMSIVRKKSEEACGADGSQAESANDIEALLVEVRTVLQSLD